MILALNIVLSFGLKKALYMIAGELTGVAIVALAAILGISALVLKAPIIFMVLKIIGAIYLIFLAYQLITSKHKSLSVIKTPAVNKQILFYQGFITSVSNPKGWAFMLAVLPAFIIPQASLTIQITLLLLIIITIEFVSSIIYAVAGGCYVAGF